MLPRLRELPPCNRCVKKRVVHTMISCAPPGMAGSQRWALILRSSARVSLVTYTAVIAAQYPELDNVQNDLVCFGNCLLGEQATSGGFLPLFWDAPSAYMHAAIDISSAVDWLQSQVVLSSDKNGCLAVLHNRNKMVATFGNSEWVTQSEGALQSKSVLLCRHDPPLRSPGTNKVRIS